MALHEKKKRSEHRRRIVYAVTMVCSILFIYFGNRIATSGPWFTGPKEELPESVSAKVVEILDRSDDSYSMDGVNTVESVQITF